MQKWLNYKYILPLILLVFLLPQPTAYGQVERNDEEVYRVLFISSYSYSWGTIPEQVNGVLASLDSEEYVLDYEFMDTKSTNYGDLYDEFYRLMSFKIMQRPTYDGIIIGDDAALQFIILYRDDLFPDTPIVFQGIDQIETGIAMAEDDLITGVVERMDYGENLKLAASLYPKAKKLVLIYDELESGIGIASQLEEQSGLVKDYEVEYVNTSLYTKKELMEKLETYQEDSIIFNISMGEQKGNILYTKDEQHDIIMNHTNIPVFSMSQAVVGNGVLGGYVIDHYESGYLAGEMMKSILVENKFPSVEIDTPSTYLFDYNIMKKFEILPSKLPKDAEIINQPETFLNKYAGWITTILAVGLLFVIVINYVRGQSKRKLQDMYDQLVITESDLQDQYRRNKKHNEALIEQEAHIRYQAEHDYLTTLPNRRVTLKMLDQLMEEQAEFTVVILDLDDFKDINDTYGHTCGDKVLDSLANRFLEITKDKQITVSRYGGDEFLFIIQNLDEKALNRLIFQVKQVIEHPITCFGFSCYVEMSMGIAHSGYEDDLVLDPVANANLALSEAKTMGKNRHMFYDCSMREKFEETNLIKNKLSEACQNDGFYLLYQPQVDLKTGGIHGYEALLRLKDHSISPGQFIPVAEESDLILRIGRIVTRKVVEQLVTWRENGHPLKPVAINFCTRQIQDKRYVGYLRDLLEEYSIPPELIEIELTESIFIDNDQQASKLFADFKALGVHLALDDFGTGYSSISYLAYIPVQKVKLDKSFVDIYLQDEKDGFIKNIIRLLHNLDLKITVEGVEERHQYERLETFGCDYIQGYYFSKPITGEEVEKFVV